MDLINQFGQAEVLPSVQQQLEVFWVFPLDHPNVCEELTFAVLFSMPLLKGWGIMYPHKLVHVEMPLCLGWGVTRLVTKKSIPR